MNTQNRRQPIFRALACIVSPTLLGLAHLTWAADYHFSLAGDDGNDGRTPATAWRTLAKAGSHTFAPGDRLLFEGGATFAGILELGGDDAGDPNQPLIVTSFGTGRATLDGGDGHAVHLANVRGVTVRELRLVGSGRNTSKRGVGLLLHPGRDVLVEQVEASGFQIAGIMVTGGSENVRMTRSYTHDNSYTRIGTGYFYGRSATNRNIYVGHSLRIDPYTGPVAGAKVDVHAPRLNVARNARYRASAYLRVPDGGRVEVIAGGEYGRMKPVGAPDANGWQRYELTFATERTDLHYVLSVGNLGRTPIWVDAVSVTSVNN